MPHIASTLAGSSSSARRNGASAGRPAICSDCACARWQAASAGSASAALPKCSAAFTQSPRRAASSPWRWSACAPSVLGIDATEFLDALSGLDFRGIDVSLAVDRDVVERSELARLAADAAEAADHVLARTLD